MRPIAEQTVLVTGATDGIGERIARNLAGQGATVLVHGRNEEVNNAGVGFGTAPSRDARTEDGHEVTWQVNVLSAFLLTVLLHDVLADGGGRVVHMSSGVASSGAVDLDSPDAPRGVDAYRQSKVALMLLAREMGDRYRGAGIDVNAVSPGWIATKMGGSGGGDLDRGADTATWLLTDPSLEGTTGRYFADRREQRPNPQTEDAEARRRLWELASSAVGL